MKILKHFFQTLLMLLSVLLIAIMPEDKYAHIVNPLLGIAIVAVLIFTAFYLYKGRKKGLFCFWGLFLFSVSFSGMAYADACYDLSVKLTRNNEYHHDFKAEVKKFDPEDAFKYGNPPDQKIVDKAVGFVDTVKKALSLGCLKSDDGWFDWSTDIHSNHRSFNSFWTEYYDDLYDAAREYLEEVAKFQDLAHEVQKLSPMAILKSERDSCWICGIVHLTIDAVERITLTMEGSLKQAALLLLGIMTLFWILIKVLILIGQFGTASNADFFTELLTRLFLVVIAAAILQAPLGQLYQVTISPLISITSKLTQQYTNYGDQTQGIGSIGNGENLKCSCCDEDSESDCNGGTLVEYGARYEGSKFKELVNKKKVTGGNIYEGVLDLEAKRDLMCMVCSVYKQTAPLVAAGRTLVYYATKIGPEYVSFWQKVLNGIIKFVTGLVFPYPFGMWFVGLIIILIFTWLALNIALKFIDIFLRFGFVILLTPFLVTAYVFPISRKYTQRGWEFLVHTMVSILATGIGIALIMAILMVQIDPGNRIKNKIGVASDNVTQFYAADLWRAFTDGTAKIDHEWDGELVREWDTNEDASYFPILMMIIICFAGTKLLNSMSIIVQGLTGISADIPSMAGAALMGAIRAAYAPFKMALNVVRDRLDSAKDSASEASEGLIEKSESRDSSSSNKNRKYKGEDKVANATEKTTNAAGNIVEKGGGATGRTIQAYGLKQERKGKATVAGGKALCKIPYVGIALGSIVMTLGYLQQAYGIGVAVTGATIKHTSRFAGKTTKFGGKVMKHGVKMVSKAAKKARKKVKDIRKKAREIKTRMKKMVPPKVRKYIKDRKKKKQEQKKNRRNRARSKYARSRLSDALGSVDSMIERSIDNAEDTLGAR